MGNDEEMDRLYQHVLKALGAAFDILEKQVEKPRKTPFGKSFVFRYEQRSVHQALIQKLARVISTLHAAYILLLHGFLQEQGALQRMLDEFDEDIIFLSNGTIDGLTDLHKRYLSYFYEEEFKDPDNPGAEHDRPMIPRKKIRAYIARIDEWPLDPSRGIETSKAISKGYSGYVHGASPHIMEMYGGNPPKFHIFGMLNTPREIEHRNDLRNYFFRGILSFILVATVFQNETLTPSLFRLRNWFQKESGMDFHQE
jgi:hypothetical protein